LECGGSTPLFSPNGTDGLDNGEMPRIAVVDGVSIYMYFLDHAPPHFHAIKGDQEAVIQIGGGLLAGSLSRSELAKVLEWAETHVDQLNVEWNNGQTGLPIHKIK
jgi:hypothetical protein